MTNECEATVYDLGEGLPGTGDLVHNGECVYKVLECGAVYTHRYGNYSWYRLEYLEGWDPEDVPEAIYCGVDDGKEECEVQSYD